jgi:hypothetical protein
LGTPLGSADRSRFAGASLALEIQVEAATILQGGIVPAQKLTELAIWPDTVRRRLDQATKVNPATAGPSGLSHEDKTDLSVPAPKQLRNVTSDMVDTWAKVSDLCLSRTTRKSSC